MISPGLTWSWQEPWPSGFMSSCAVEWLDVQHETAVGQLLEHECDLVFGEAVAANLVADDEELTGKLLYSRPYYRHRLRARGAKNGPTSGHWRSSRERNRNAWGPKPARSPITASASAATFAGFTAINWRRSKP